MLISTLNSLLRSVKGDSARAWITEGETKANGGKRGAGLVNVVFAEGGKSYQYRDSIYAVAERLGLIPEVNIVSESERIYREYSADTNSVIGAGGCSDQLRYRHEINDGQYWTCEDAGKDEYDRKLSRYYRLPKPNWMQ